MDTFIRIASKIQDDFPILAEEIGWHSFDYSLECGLALNPAVLIMLWDMNIKQKSSTLPFIANYILERPTIDRQISVKDRLPLTLDIVVSQSQSKTEIICAMAPSLLSIDFANDLK